MTPLAPIPPDGALPANYERARYALAMTVQIDECKTWSDKAAALASYARQAKDDSLQKLAMRIHGRAVRRAGELLREIEPARGKQDRNEDGTIRSGAVPNGRTAAADAAGLSERQRKTALSVAALPRDQFEEAVESDNPPTITELSEMAQAHARAQCPSAPEPQQPAPETNPIGQSAVRALWGQAAADDPDAFKAATQIAAALGDLASLYQQSPPPPRIVRVMLDHERAELRRSLLALSPRLSETLEALS
ncbi:hypothetical protein U5801_26520 [Lamprobacter modestohalophilus]|uniref:hypothetical protein n=1 Tax=Lamprobacter modestohalophilus TaxID=1064514 RepID=UPI002ADEC3BC|nr:hypothetical protein [Lamprobacter modestohalophilus]MEA1053330.1 hypothetical protein [Lamprobacter modestohalophilus]